MINRTEKEIMQTWEGDISKPVVSVVSATYNHEKYIEEAIDSFLMQETDFPFEVVVGEDCSTDGTRSIVKDYAEKYPNIIKPIFWEQNVGAAKNWLTLLETANGEYIANCEGDDYWTDSHKLQIQVDEMKKKREICMSFHLATTVNQNGQMQYPQLKKSNHLYSIRDIICSDFHLVQTNTIMFKKISLNNINFELLAKSPVGDVWIRIASSMPNGALFINRTMGAYRIQSEGSWSESTQEDKKFISFITSMIKSIDDFDKYWNYIYTKEFRFLKNKFINVLMKKDQLMHLRKKDFILSHLSSMSMQNLMSWYLLYRYEIVVKILRKIKKNLILEVKNVQTNIK